MAPKIPLYYSILESIREDILMGVYPVGSLLPAEKELEAMFDVSKITIRKAIELLEADGYVEKKSGRGTTVLSNSLYNKLSKGESFSHILNSKGFVVTKQHTTFSKLDLKATDDLSKFFNKKTVEMKRMYYIDDSPYIFMEHYFPGTVSIPKTIKDDNTFSLYMFLYNNDYQLARFEDSFSIVDASLEVKKKLELEKDYVLLRKRITYSSKNEVVEVAYAYYNTAIHPYQINYLI